MLTHSLILGYLWSGAIAHICAHRRDTQFCWPMLHPNQKLTEKRWPRYKLSFFFPIFCKINLHFFMTLNFFSKFLFLNHSFHSFAYKSYNWPLFTKISKVIFVCCNTNIQTQICRFILQKGERRSLWKALSIQGATQHQLVYIILIIIVDNFGNKTLSRGQYWIANS